MMASWTETWSVRITVDDQLAKTLVVCSVVWNVNFNASVNLPKDTEKYEC
jgi:hypothetical protein